MYERVLELLNEVVEEKGKKRRSALVMAIKELLASERSAKVEYKVVVDDSVAELPGVEAFGMDYEGVFKSGRAKE